MDDENTKHLRDWSRRLYRALETNDGSRSFVDCLDTAADGQCGAARNVLDAVRKELMLGNSLSGAMSLHPDVFPRDLITIVRYGELYGELDVVLRRYVECPEDTALRCRLPVTS